MDTYRLCVDFPNGESLLRFIESCNAFWITGSPSGAMKMDSLHEKTDGKLHKFILRDLREEGSFLAVQESGAVAVANTYRVRVEWETDGEDVELPELIQVPSDIDYDNVADWISEGYGWLVQSWKEEK